jgi:hypothetical protein
MDFVLAAAGTGVAASGPSKTSPTKTRVIALKPVVPGEARIAPYCTAFPISFPLGQAEFVEKWERKRTGGERTEPLPTSGAVGSAKLPDYVQQYY